MKRVLFWKLCLVITVGVVTLFYLLSIIVTRAEREMSLLTEKDRRELLAWQQGAEQLFNANEMTQLERWIQQLEQKENTWVSVAKTHIHHIAGSGLKSQYIEGHNLGRSIEWKIHLYFKDNPVMELPFENGQASLLIQLPQRMRPGSYWQQTKIAIQVLIPMIILGLLSFILYRHIMSPLRQLERATREFSRGNFEIRVENKLGSRDDELAELTRTFDQMAERIGELIQNQRQLIADLSHELRTPLTRLDIAVNNLQHSKKIDKKNIDRIHHESAHIRKLVEDTLTLAWLENERPELKEESIELVDLVDVLVQDATFEFPDRKVKCTSPNSLSIKNSNHRAIGQALENILRNALRYTPPGESVDVSIHPHTDFCEIKIADCGPGVDKDLLQKIFEPFFRVENDRKKIEHNSGYGLGLALAKRQLSAVGAKVLAKNRDCGGLQMTVQLPIG